MTCSKILSFSISAIFAFATTATASPHQPIPETEEQITQRICSGEVRSAAEMQEATKRCSVKMINEVYARIQALEDGIQGTQSQIDSLKKALPGYYAPLRTTSAILSIIAYFPGTTSIGIGAVLVTGALRSGPHYSAESHRVNRSMGIAGLKFTAAGVASYLLHFSVKALKESVETTVVTEQIPELEKTLALMREELTHRKAILKSITDQMFGKTE